MDCHSLGRESAAVDYVAGVDLPGGLLRDERARLFGPEKGVHVGGADEVRRL